MVPKLKLSRPLATGWHFIRYLVVEFFANQGVLNAAALTYTTLLAVVPLMTVTYAMLASIPTFQGVGEQLESMVFNHFVPSSAETVQDYLSDFASQARTLTAVGVGFLMATALLMLKTVENTFNQIWRVQKPRRGLSSFLLYWAVLTLGPMLLGLGFALTSYLASLPFVTGATEALGGAKIWLSILPIIFSTAAFTLIYAAVPNCSVPLRNAFIGGFVISIIFEAAKRLFTFFVTHFPTYELIYGAFAAFPMFLAWIYISWLIVLLGAELVRALSTYRGPDHEEEKPHLLWMLKILEVLWESYPKGRQVSRKELLKRLPGLHTLALDDYLERLSAAKLITGTEQGGQIFCRNPASIDVDALWRSMPWPLPGRLGAFLEDPWEQEVDRRLRSLDRERKEILSQDLDSLFAIKATSVSSQSSDEKKNPIKEQS